MPKCSEILQQIMKLFTFQPSTVKSFNTVCAASILTTNVQNPQDTNREIPSPVACSTVVCCMPDQTALRHCCICSFKIFFLNHSKWFYSILFIANAFTNLLAPKPLNSCRFKKMIALHRPISWISVMLL